MEILKKLLHSDSFLELVNILLLLVLLFFATGVYVILYAIWIIFLVYCIKNAASKKNRFLFAAFIGLAVAMIIVNVYGVITA